MRRRSTVRTLVRRATLVFTVTAAAAALLPATAQAAPVAPATVLGSIDDGPGRFSVFRTVDSGLRPTDADNAGCAEHWGGPPRSLTVVERLDARLYTFDSSSSTGFLTDPTANDVGPIYVCNVPALDGQAFLGQWGRMTAPGLGEVTMNGPCGIEFYIGEPGRGAVDCVLRLDPNDSGVTGGVATSNSVVNPARLPDGRTGSVWTMYTTGEADAPVDAPKPGTPQPTGSVKYSVTREVNSSSTGATAACPGGVRTTALHPTGVDAATGTVDPEPSETAVATATVCYQLPGGPDSPASLTITHEGVTPALTATSTGQCRRLELAEAPGSMQQSCGFTLPPNFGRGLTGGQVTVNGLVPIGDPAGSDNSAVWTTGLLGSITPDL